MAWKPGITCLSNTPRDRCARRPCSPRCSCFKYKKIYIFLKLITILKLIHGYWSKDNSKHILQDTTFNSVSTDFAVTQINQNVLQKSLRTDLFLLEFLADLAVLEDQGSYCHRYQEGLSDLVDRGIRVVQLHPADRALHLQRIMLHNCTRTEVIGTFYT